MSDIIFCELCGAEAKNDKLEMRGRSLVVCSKCVSDYTSQIDRVCSDAWDAEIAKIKATKNIDTAKLAVIQAKIDTLIVQKEDVLKN
jgi:ribosome-binding protein aMBF1 (putative translation factor)